ARVDEDELPPGPGGLDLDPVARDPRLLVGDGLSPAVEPVHERGLPDVLPAHDGHLRWSSHPDQLGSGGASSSRRRTASRTASKTWSSSICEVSRTVAPSGGTNGVVRSSAVFRAARASAIGASVSCSRG